MLEYISLKLIYTKNACFIFFFNTANYSFLDCYVFISRKLYGHNCLRLVAKHCKVFFPGFILTFMMCKLLLSVRGPCK